MRTSTHVNAFESLQPVGISTEDLAHDTFLTCIEAEVEATFLKIECVVDPAQGVGDLFRVHRSSGRLCCHRAALISAFLPNIISKVGVLGNWNIMSLFHSAQDHKSLGFGASYAEILA